MKISEHVNQGLTDAFQKKIALSQMAFRWRSHIWFEIN